MQETRQHILDVARTLMTNKGYTAVGLAEVVATARVPKGSFYYYFKSKEEFGQALLEEYFSAYLSTVDSLLSTQGQTPVERLLNYFRYWSDTQGTDLPDGKCLVVKLGPEVCDLSDDMRSILEQGTRGIVARIAGCVAAGQAEGQIATRDTATALAESLYQLWLGASLLAKLGKRNEPFDIAMATTRRLLE
ncbi:TetR/AcrR family transcriptional regulator, transcriptional repressor for nem operon [Janthinobacterium sp. CG_23.3]